MVAKRLNTPGYGLTTANILYRRPDHPWLLQSYVWQSYDECPEFPALHRFLAFWQDFPRWNASLGDRRSFEARHTGADAHSKRRLPATLKATRMRQRMIPKSCGLFGPR